MIIVLIIYLKIVKNENSLYIPVSKKLIKMGSGSERMRILKNHEAEILRIKMMADAAELEAEIKRIAEKNKYTLGMEEIRRLREKDLAEYQFKNEELRKKHEQFLLKENHRHEEEKEKIANNLTIETKKIEELRDYHAGLIEVEKIKGEKEITELKNQGAEILKKMDVDMNTVNKEFESKNLIIAKNHEENMTKSDQKFKLDMDAQDKQFLLEMEKLKLEKEKIEKENLREIKKIEKSGSNQNETPGPLPPNNMNYYYMNNYIPYYQGIPLYPSNMNTIPPNMYNWQQNMKNIPQNIPNNMPAYTPNMPAYTPNMPAYPPNMPAYPPNIPTQ